ncbi:MAG: hypothetical protein V1769_05500, partial [Thermoplasmatota archaeon]
MKLLREQPDIVRKNLEKRKDPTYITMFETLLERDEQWRRIKNEIDALRQKRNQLTEIVKNLKDQGKQEEILHVVKEAKMIPQQISEKEQRLIQLEEEKNSLLLQLPNLLHDTVPYGEDDAGNVTEKVFGDTPRFSFPVKSHVDLVELLRCADIERGAKISGARFYFLKNELVEL